MIWYHIVSDEMNNSLKLIPKLTLEHVQHVPRRKTNIGLKSLSYTGPSLWNNLNENLKRSSSINDFKHKIKEFYFEEFKKTKHES